jgi:hypothetical protein
MSRVLRICYWALLALAATAIGVVSLRYLSGDPAVAPRALRVNMIERLPWFLAHTVAGAIALLVLPWQLLPALRRRRPRLHRWLGRIYVAAVAVSGTAALPIALGHSPGRSRRPGLRRWPYAGSSRRSWAGGKCGSAR